MEKNKIKKYQIFSGIFVFILGFLLHFTYKMSGENQIIAAFSSVNESVWEHLKLVYFPMLITIIIGEFYFFKYKNNFLCSQTLGLIVSMAFIVIFFYVYTGILGKSIAIIDILSFFISVILGEYISYKFMVNGFKCNKSIAIIILVTMCISFIIFTYKTPQIGIFKDPITGQYGIINKK